MEPFRRAPCDSVHIVQYTPSACLAHRVRSDRGVDLNDRRRQAEPSSVVEKDKGDDGGNFSTNYTVAGEE